MKKQQLKRKINRARFLIIDLDEMIKTRPSAVQVKTMINEILEALADDPRVKK